MTIIPHQLFTPAPEQEQPAPSPSLEDIGAAHLETAAFAAEQLSTLSEQLAVALRTAPDDIEALRATRDLMRITWQMIHEHYDSRLAVLSCEGQA